MLSDSKLEASDLKESILDERIARLSAQLKLLRQSNPEAFNALSGGEASELWPDFDKWGNR